MIQLLLLIGLVLFAVYAAQRFLQRAPAGSAHRYRRGLFWGAVVLALVLVASGRLALLIPLLGALVASLLRMLPLLVPLLLRYLPLWLRQRQGARTAGTASSADVSTVESGFLRMRLDHVSGEIAGEVLKGVYAGRYLSELSPQQLTDLYREYTRADPESATLLRAYLDRVYGESWEDDGEAPHEAPSGGRMSREEALQVLGLAPKASREEIIGAHRRLMQKLHPDRGGSDYLAAKINQAKDVLLG